MTVKTYDSSATVLTTLRVPRELYNKVAATVKRTKLKRTLVLCRAIEAGLSMVKK